MSAALRGLLWGDVTKLDGFLNGIGETLFIYKNLVLLFLNYLGKSQVFVPKFKIAGYAS
jgi:hypothetical protein